MRLDTYVAARFVRSDGAELLADGNDWLITDIDGADAATYALFSEDGGSGDGGATTGKRVSARDLTLGATTLSVKNNPVLRERALSFFNPKHTFRVYLTYMGRTRWLAAEISAFSAPSTRVNIPQKFTACFLAKENPYWQSVDDFGKDIAAITPRWGFPYMDHPELGVLVDVANFARKVVFDYDGNVPAYPAITITADAPVTNPKIVNGTAFVRLIDELDAGDIVNITTAPQRVRITKNGVNVLNKVDRASNFSGMALQPGTNVVSFAADYGDNNLHVVLRYNKQYLGV